MEVMGRARRARRIAARAAYGGGGLAAATAAVGALGWGVVKAEAAIARRIVGTIPEDPPADDGMYGAGAGVPVRLVMLGDSTAVGLGTDTPAQTVGAIIASGVAALTGRPVQLVNRAVSGAESSDLSAQFTAALDAASSPDVVVVMVGANDVTHGVDRAAAVRSLEEVVHRVREIGGAVVVGTCPDLGTIEPFAQPLRWLARRWSRDLAAAQTVAVVEAGGRTVSLGDLLGPQFAAAPQEMFSDDRFHPSPAGYARAAAALLPSVCAALGVWAGDTTDRAPELRRGEGVGPVAIAAGQAVLDPGSEVAPTQVGGQSRGPRGRWAVLLHRRQGAVPESAAGSEPISPPPGQGMTPSEDDPVRG